MPIPSLPDGVHSVVAIDAKGGGVPGQSAVRQRFVSACRDGARVKPRHGLGADTRADFDRLVNGQLRAEHDGDIEGILAPMSDAIIHEVVGLADDPVQGLEAVRHRYRDLLAASVHERDIPLRRRYGPGFVLDEHVWSGRLTGRAFDIDGHGRWLSHRVLWLLEVRDGRIVRETVWNDLSAIRKQLV
jgi:ketosteroid isomerase-like protein